MFRKRTGIDKDNEYLVKAAAVKASTSVVSIISHNLPVDICENLRGYCQIAAPPAKRAHFFSNGIILESHISANDDTTYLSTILAPACLFSHIPPDKIDIDVYPSSGLLCKAKLLACDFHYNLALITINSDSPLPTALLMGIDAVLSIDPNEYDHPNKKIKSFGLQPHSPLFKVAPNTPIFTVYRSFSNPLALVPKSGTLSFSPPKGFSCSELFGIKEYADVGYFGGNGAPVLNSLGQVIGMVFDGRSFLPINIILKWWNCYKSSGGFCRPFLGMEVISLPEADFNLIAQLITRFPNISKAVVVTKVEEGSPAYHSGIRTNDVIVKLEGKLLQSKLEFYERIWEKAGEAEFTVKLSVRRVTDGKKLKVELVIEETPQSKFHEWPHPSWGREWDRVR